MKIITLNTWGGKMHDELNAFLKEKQDIDVFCFQEVLSSGQGKTDNGETKNLYENITKVLENHKGYFSEYGNGGYYGKESKDLDFKYGVACFVKKDLKQSFVDGVSLFEYGKRWDDYEGPMAAGAAIVLTVSDFLIVNIHGLWQKYTKKDTKARLEQSEKIIKLANKGMEKKIICGDFNLEPDTESIKMFENLPMKNLIKEHNILSTRTSLTKKDVRFADYMFVDNRVNILKFQILTDEVSDHSPIYVECI